MKSRLVLGTCIGNQEPRQRLGVRQSSGAMRRDRKRQGTGALQDLAESRRFMESEIQLSTLPGIDCQVQTCGGTQLSGLWDGQDVTSRNRQKRSSGASAKAQSQRPPNRENLRIMAKTMLITLLLTTTAGFGAIKLGAFALENDAVKSFLSQFNRGSSMNHQAATFESMPPAETSAGPFLGPLPPGRWPHPGHARRFSGNPEFLRVTVLERRDKSAARTPFPGQKNPSCWKERS